VPDLRYHVVSLIGVFIALSLGLLLGIALAEGDSFESQLQAQVEDIRGDLERQRELISEREERIVELQEETASDEEVIEGISSVVLDEGYLQGYEVALVVGPYASQDASGALQRDLTAAGATIVAIEELEAPDEDATPQALEAEYRVQAREVLGGAEGQDAGGDTTGEAGGGTEVLSGPDAPDVVVFLGGGDPPEGTDEETLQAVADAQRAMFEVWQEAEGEEASLRVVAAETTGSERSEVPLFEEVGVPSQDNVDSAAGRAGVVLLAAGDAEGTYGVKETASDPFPPPPADGG